jgi:hypothetical protein
VDGTGSRRRETGSILVDSYADGEEVTGGGLRRVHLRIAMRPAVCKYADAAGPTIVTAQKLSCPFASANPRATTQRVLRRYARARAGGLMADAVRLWPTSSAPALYIACVGKSVRTT